MALDWSAPDDDYSRSGLPADMSGSLDELEGSLLFGVKGKGTIQRKSLFRGRRPHGGFDHVRLMKKQVKELRQIGVPARHIRTNQVLVDEKGRSLCNLKPDVQGYHKATDTIYIRESLVTQTKRAADDKWKNIIPTIQAKGYNVDYDTLK